MNNEGLKHPGRWIWLLLLIPIILGLMRLRFDVDVLNLLPPDLEAVQGLKLHQEHFANARELIITVETGSAESTEDAARAIAHSLRNRPDLATAVTWEPPWLEHPQQAAELIAYLWLNQPPDDFAALTNRLATPNLPGLLSDARGQLATSLSPEEIARLSYDPFGLTRLPDRVAAATPAFGRGQEAFSSEDGRFRLLFVSSNRELLTYQECNQWLAQVQQLVTGAVKGKGAVRLGYTGRPAFVSEVSSGMEHDITVSVTGTAVIIGLLFWLAHRRLKPMLWLLLLLALILGATLALGGLIFGAINVISLGFAAILLGLAVDYAVVHYQEALAHPHLNIPQIRRAIAPSILWAAVTTIAAFLALNLGGLPGLAQLGTLVGLGVALSAGIMIYEFLPPLFPGRDKAPALATKSETVGSAITGNAPLPGTAVAFTVTVILVVGCLGILTFGLPGIDPTAKPLRPCNSQAYAALERVQRLFSKTREPLWLIVRGQDERDTSQRLAQVQSALEQAAKRGEIAGFSLPAMLWPNPDFQSANRAAALGLAARSNALLSAATTAGFAEPAFGLAQKVMETWLSAAQSPGVFWPTNAMSTWIFNRVSARTPAGFFALGLLTPLAGEGGAEAQAQLGLVRAELPREHVWLSGWELLGSSIFAKVKGNTWLIMGPMACLVLLSLAIAFRRPAEVLLSLAVLALSGLCLLAVMRLAGWSWNLLNLMAIPLVLGTGVDYSLFTQLALRRHGGDLRVAYYSVGRALLLCGGTAVAGFGSLTLSSNAGMASLGAVCAVGIAGNMLIAIFLLPQWWRRFAARPEHSSLPGARSPSVLYRAGVWRIGLALVRMFPRRLSLAIASTVSTLYWTLAGHRRRIAHRNLALALRDNSASAGRTTRQLVRNFNIKIVDLLRCEAGLSVDELLGDATGWEHFEAARAANRGVLLLTPHLGNWEFGARFLLRQKVGLQVVTLSEPGSEFTDLRRAARARSNIETLVVGSDPFGFIEIIRRLEAGATVALLVDRPSPSTAANVRLFGHPFPTSIAAAELARASGCALLPVYIPWTGRNYAAHLLPPVPYDRAALRTREERVRLCQRIMDAFEPVIEQHLDQWYHFVPIWPENPGD